MTRGERVGVMEGDDHRNHSVDRLQPALRNGMSYTDEARLKVAAPPQAHVPSVDLAVAGVDVGQQHVQPRGPVGGNGALVIPPGWWAHQRGRLAGDGLDVRHAVVQAFRELGVG